MASGLLLLHPHSTTTPHFSTVAYHEKKQPVDCDSVRETTALHEFRTDVLQEDAGNELIFQFAFGDETELPRQCSDH